MIEQPALPRFQGLRRLSYTYKILRDMRGQFPRTCNLCGFQGKFLPAGRPPRYDGKCPRCMSVERHRLLCLANEGAELIRDGDRVLHFAPEPALRSYLRGIAGSYESADIVPGRADLTLNVEKLDLEDASYDVIVASHVLEHVDDAAALGELIRVLKPGGRLIVFTPVIEGWASTYEDETVTSERGRLQHFGQFDHVRYFGRDVRDRIVAAGFELNEYQGTPAEVIEFGLVRGETMFVGVRTA